METFAAWLAAEIHAPVTIFVGGSHMIGEAGAASDVDWYVMVPNFFCLWRLHTLREHILAKKRALNIASECIVVTPFLIRCGFLSVYGQLPSGQVIESAIHPRFLATNFLKVACDLYVLSLSGGDNAGYMLGKSALYTVASLALANGWSGSGHHPLVALHVLGPELARHPEIPHIDQLPKIMQYKVNCSAPTPSDDAVVRDVILFALERALERPLSLWSHILSAARAPVPFRERVMNHDHAVLRGWKQILLTGDRAEQKTLSACTAYVYTF